MASVAVHLVRHGETDWNVEGRLQGWTDIPLNATGRGQALLAAEELSRLPIGAIFSSDLSRARDTAAAIAAPLGIEVVTDPALRERNYGVAEGRLNSELNAELGGRLADYWAEPDFAFDGGETRREAYARLAGFFLEVLPSAPPHIVVVSHGGALRVARGFLGGYPVEELPSWSSANAEITTVVVPDQLWSSSRISSATRSPARAQAGET